MKTQRRHELQTNVLADYLGKQIQTVRPHFKTITIGAIAVLLALVGYVYLLQQQRARAGKGWADYFKAIGNRDVKQLDEVAQLHSGTVAGFWARQAAADLKLAKGSGELFTDRKEAQKSLREAEENYVAIEKDATAYPLLVERARFGLAQVYEGYSDVGKAQKYYEKVAQANPSSALAKAAQHRAEQLADKSTESWYNWFERQQPVARRTSPPGKEGPQVPGDLDALPDKPDLKRPSEEVSKALEAPPQGDAKPAEKPLEQPKSDAPAKEDPKSEKSAPPAPEQPATAGPAGTPPSPAAKPAAVPATPEQPAEKDAP
jgi:tetratricopeptide (TPR) repeat protein